MVSREKILAYMLEGPYKPLTAEELAAALKIKTQDTGSFVKLLNKLELAGEIILTRKGRYGLPERMGLAVGRLQGHPKGFGFVLPDKINEPDVYVSGENLNSAMHNDRVVVRVAIPADGRKPEGEIIRVLQRANRKVVGTYERTRHLSFVVPDENRLARDVLIPEGESKGARQQDKVVVEITRWPEKRRNPEGRVIEVLGQREEPGVDVLSIVRKNELPESFPKQVLKEAEEILLTIPAEDLAGRWDFRDWPMVTIDGEDAKDLDDAVSIEAMPDGRFRLGVHIADVAHYVKEGSRLDREALKRGTSVYLVDRVIPMLPPRLSNGICSLNAGEDRLALSILMEVEGSGNVCQHEICPSVIRVKERMTYEAVSRILAGEDEELIRRYQSLVEKFKQMEKLCRVLSGRREGRGAVDFNFPDSKVKLDEQGKPVEIKRVSRSIADQIIEEFMLLANETVAAHFHHLETPFIYRVHEGPDREAMTSLNEFLHAFGYHVKSGATGSVHPRAFQEVIKKVAGRPEEKFISTMMLRSMKHARYDSACLGHFGLASKDYCHFTSPIRRYPDLAIHRMIHEVLAKGKIAARRKIKLEEVMAGQADQCSLREKIAEDAERESVDLKKVEYMERFIGSVFPGVVSGVVAFGMFVELENSVEGLVHVSTMADDYYQFIDKQMSLIGQHTKKTYRIGTPVEVLVARVDKDVRQVDFELVETPQSNR